MWCRFDADQLVTKDGKLLVTQAGRHFLIGGLPPSVLGYLLQAHDNGVGVQLKNIPKAASKVLLEAALLVPDADAADEVGLSVPRSARRPALTYLIANTIRHSGSIAGLIVLCLASMALYLYSHTAVRLVSIGWLVESTPPLHIGLAIMTLMLTGVIHELGHAAAACYYTGTVGTFQFRLLWGVPAITIDVTSVCLASRGGKVAISMAGGIFQLFASLCLLAFTDVFGIRCGAAIAIYLAIFNLLPLPHYDGYWILVDLFGRKFSPRLIDKRNLLDVGYGIALLVVVGYVVPHGISAIEAQTIAGANLITGSPVRGAVLLLFSAFAIMSLCVFLWSLARSLLGVTPASKVA